jgi:hypothetical protein
MKISKNKIFPIFLLLVHLIGIGIQSFHYHTHFVTKESDKTVFTLSSVLHNHSDNEDNCSICYFSNQHVSHETIQFHCFGLGLQYINETSEYNFYFLTIPSEIPQRGPPQS